MTLAARQNDARTLVRLLHALGWSAAALVGWVGLPYAWHRSLSAWWLYGRDAPASWPAVTLLLALALVAWMVRLTAGRAAAFPRRFAVAATLAGWCLTNAAFWWSMASPLVRDAGFAMVFVGSTLWLLWLWAMFFVSHRWRVRCRVLIAALGLACALPACARACGIDGGGRPLLAWRFRPSAGKQAGRLHHKGNPPSWCRPPACRLPGAKPSGIHENSEHGGAHRNSRELGYGEYPCFRGLDGLAVVDDVQLADDWSRSPPRELWRREVGAGWGSFAVSGGFAFTQEQRGENETVVCYDLDHGRQVWEHIDGGCFRSGTAGDGPRATPNVAGERVFSLGASGILNCLDRRTGRRRWSIDVLTDNRASNLFHGLSGSPLVVAGLVVVSAGGREGKSLAAYDCETGERVWRAGDDAAGYGSPQLCKLAGHEQIVILNRATLAGHAVGTGRVLWTYAWENSTATNCSQAVPFGQRLFVSSGYGKGCCLLELTPNIEAEWSARQVWANHNLKTKFTSAVTRDGFVFGLDEGVLCCIDLADGTRRWRAGRYGHGQLLLAGDKLVVQVESGEVALVAAAPDEHHELARFTALNDKTWNHPALAGRLLLVRNDREAACYELSGEVASSNK